MRKPFDALLLLLCLAAVARAGSSAGVPARVLPFAAQGLELSFHPETGGVYLGGERLPASAVFSDSKGWAAKLPNETRDIVKIYAGPRYNGPGQMTKTRDELNGMGEREAKIFRDLAPLGLAPRIKESGFIPDGPDAGILFHSIAGVGSAYSGRFIMRRGKFHDEAVLARVREIADALAAGGHYVEKLNPTSFLFPRKKGVGGALLVKSYTEDASVAPEERAALAAHYARRIKVFAAMSSVYPKLREKGAALSSVEPGVEVREETQVLLMLWDAMLAKRQVKVLYTNSKNETKWNAVWPVRGASPKDDLMKGYVRVAYKQGGSEFTFRLDRISTAVLLP